MQAADCGADPQNEATVKGAQIVNSICAPRRLPATRRQGNRTSIRERCASDKKNRTPTPLPRSPVPAPHLETHQCASRRSPRSCMLRSVARSDFNIVRMRAKPEDRRSIPRAQSFKPRLNCLTLLREKPLAALAKSAVRSASPRHAREPQLAIVKLALAGAQGSDPLDIAHCRPGRVALSQERIFRLERLATYGRSLSVNSRRLSS
jgi:hypothetical protein